MYCDPSGCRPIWECNYGIILQYTDTGTGGGRCEPDPKPYTKKEASTERVVAETILEGTVDAGIAFGVGKALAPRWVQTAPLAKVPLKTLTNVGKGARFVKGFTKAAGVLTVAAYGYDVYPDTQNYSGWSLVGAISIGTLSTGGVILAGAGLAATLATGPAVIGTIAIATVGSLAADALKQLLP